jgi:small subunit ribosomal protein S4
MGDPRKITNKYKTPMHPWQKERMEIEKPLMKTYGLVNKTELWRVNSKLKKFKDNAKKLVALKGNQAEVERNQLVEKLKSFNLVQSESLDEVLGMKLDQFLDRRLQTVVFKKGLARTVKQARQMITHGHVMVNGKKMTAPGYLVRVSEEDGIIFIKNSTFNDPEHPERAVKAKEVKETKEVKESKKQEKKEEAPKKKEAEEPAKKEE